MLSLLLLLKIILYLLLYFIQKRHKLRQQIINLIQMTNQIINLHNLIALPSKILYNIFHLKMFQNLNLNNPPYLITNILQPQQQHPHILYPNLTQTLCTKSPHYMRSI
jgi:Ni,Fe-hydrogenase I small subunit